jgi:YHS domain-containing protein
MVLERDRAVLAGWDGRTFYFCCRGCSQEFLAEPERFAPASQ